MGRRIKCLVCEKWIKLFGTERMASHVATHDDLLLLVCRVCGLTFRDIEIYKEHRLTHDDKNDFILEIPLDFSCTLCGKKFNTKQSLRQHKVVHDEIGKFKCDECGKECKRKHDLFDHLQTHSNERSFNCPTCGKAFKSKKYLSQHSKHCKDSLI
jgi:KRAB domain-containing zinc finger protein